MLLHWLTDWLHACMPQCTCGGKERTCRNWSSSTTVCVLKTELRSSVMTVSAFTHILQSLPTSPLTWFSTTSGAESFAYVINKKTYIKLTFWCAVKVKHLLCMGMLVWRLRQEEKEPEASLGYCVRHYLWRTRTKLETTVPKGKDVAQ